MTVGNGKPSLERAGGSDWTRRDSDTPGTERKAANDGARRPQSGGDASFSPEAHMAHELVSLFLAIDNQETRERCLAFVREQAEGRSV